MRPELTIAIPTYNRVDKLKYAMKDVIEYSKGKNIEIIVSDNASTDGTRDYVNSITEKYTLIKYYRNNENLGFDGNFLNCLEKANGKYVWLLSDDDILLPGAIESVLEALKEYPICMHLNTSSLISEEPFKFTAPRFEEEGIVKYLDKNEFLHTVGIYCTFVSSLVFNVDLVHEIDDKEQYFRTNILQSHVYLETMKRDGVYIINTKNCLVARSNRIISYDLYRTWINNYSELLLNTGKKCGFDKQILSEVLEKSLDTNIYNFILFFRRTCKNAKEWDKDCIWKWIYNYPRLRMKYCLAVNAPIFLLPLLTFVYKIKMICRRK